MKKIVFAVLLLVLISGCSTMQPPRYSVSTDNNQKLKNFEGAKIQFLSISQSAEFDSNCRLVGPIEPADGLTCPEFICKAFNDELKMAGLYSTDGVKIGGDITKIEFSSSSGLTNGYWDISLELKSSNGRSLTVSNKYSFKSGFDAVTACNATADALTPAVQDLINSAISNPNFKKLIKS